MRRVRQFSYWSFLAFFAVVSVGGRGMHLLPGFAHSCAPGATACAHRHSHAAVKHSAHHQHTAHTGCVHGHHADHAHPSETPAPADAPVEQHSDDGCLLCQFCSQAQQQTYTLDLLPTGSCFAAPPALVARPSTTFQRSYQSRAPPAERSAA